MVGKSLAHLQCHVGLDTLSWARLGAEATGLDFSGPAIAAARQYAGDLGLPARFVEGDVYEAPRLLGRTYDIVFTSVGVLCWLQDLERWADAVAALLQPGGLFYIMDGHPFTEIFEDVTDPDGETPIKPHYGYFDKSPLRLDAAPTYTDAPEGAVVAETVEWLHPLSEIVNCLIGAGLRIETLGEHPHCGYGKFACMEEVEPGRFEMPGDLAGKLPMFFSIRAVKP